MKNRTKLIIGLILILWGMSLIAQDYGIYHISFGNLVPYIFIAVGVWLIIRRRKMETITRMDREAKRTEPPMSSQPFRNESISVNIYTQKQSEQKFEHAQTETTEQKFEERVNKIPYNKFFGDIFVNLNNIILECVEVSTFIGDIEVNLTGGVLKDGLNRIIISSFIGNIRIITTQDMPIFINSSNFIGDINCLGNQSSGFGNNIDAQTQNYESSSKKLYIASNCFIGDIKITEV
jgi:predicted membrane protein